MGGVINLLVCLALMYVLIKIPFWILGSLRVSSGRSVIGSLARAYVTGRVFGAVLGRGAGRAAGSAGRRGSGGSLSGSVGGAGVDDPSWPVAPQVYWGTPGGGRRLDRARGEIRARHLAEQYRSRPRGTGGRSGVRSPTFQQPVPQTPSHDRAAGGATQAPKPTVFRAADATMTTASGRPVAPPTPRHRSRVPRRYPPFSAPGAPTARRPVAPAPPPMPAAAVASVPEALRFQPATPPAPVVPVQRPGPVATPVFQAAEPDRGAVGRRGYTHTPAPVVFQPSTGTPVSRTPPPGHTQSPQPHRIPPSKAQQPARPNRPRRSS